MRYLSEERTEEFKNNIIGLKSIKFSKEEIEQLKKKRELYLISLTPFFRMTIDELEESDHFKNLTDQDKYTFLIDYMTQNKIKINENPQLEALLSKFETGRKKEWQKEWIKDLMGYLQDFDTIGERKDRLKLIIAEIEMRVINDEYFNENDIDFYGNIIDVMPIIKAYLNYLESFPTNIESEGLELNGNIPINLEDQDRFVYCHIFGIIDYLKDHIRSDGSKYTDRKLYKYISLVTNISESTVKRLMTFSKNPDNADPNNPFNKNEVLDRIKKMILNNNMLGKF